MRRSLCVTSSESCCRTSPGPCPGSRACFPAAATTSNHCRFQPLTTRPLSRITLVTKGSEAVVQQIVNQLHKLIDVVAVDDMTSDDHLERELALIKLRVRPASAMRCAALVEQAGGRVLSDEQRLPHRGAGLERGRHHAACAQRWRSTAELLEIVRSGALAMSRQERILHVVES